MAKNPIPGLVATMAPIVCLVFLFGAAVSHATDSAADTEANDPGTDQQQEEPREAGSEEARSLAAKWSYQVTVDEMTSKPTRLAAIRSENSVSFRFPYEGAQRATLIIRDHPTYGRDIIFRIERGQLLCNSYDRCRVRVRFDENEPQQWDGSPSTDQSSEVIFLRNYDKFLNSVTSSSVLRIQPEVYQEGSPVFEFHIGGFDLDRYRNGS